MLQSQKMESMGELAGGMAHDFQNVLTAILAHTEVLRRHVRTDDFGKRRIKTIEDAAKRAGQMIGKLLSFARKESMELVATDVNSVVTDSVELVGRALLEHGIKIRMMLDPEIPFITGDAIHLEQVIANLVMNARDAMPEERDDHDLDGAGFRLEGCGAPSAFPEAGQLRGPDSEGFGDGYPAGYPGQDL